MDENECRAVIFHNFRTKFYGEMIRVAAEFAGKFKNAICFRLYHALGLLLNNRVDECVRVLETIKNEREIKLAAAIALLYANKIKRCSSRAVYEKLDSEMRENRKNADASDFYNSAFVLLVLDKSDKSLDYLEKALNMQSDMIEAATMKAWLWIAKSPQDAEKLFERVLKDNKKNLDACMGHSECLLFLNKVDLSLESINKAVVRFPNSTLPLVQKMRVYFASQDWEHCLETAKRAGDRMECLRTIALVHICKDCDYDTAAGVLVKLSELIDELEPKNAIAMHETAQLFARICGRNREILHVTLELSLKSMEINDENCNFIVEQGHQNLLLDRIKDAERYFKAAVKLDEKSFEGLLGMTLCEILQDNVTSQVKNQVDYLLEFDAAQNSALFYYVRSKVTDNSQESLIFLKKSADILISTAQKYPYSEAYLRTLNPDLILEIVKEYLKFDPNKSKPALDLLKLVLGKALPEMEEPLYLLSKLQYLNGDHGDAVSNLDKVLKRKDDENSLLLLARIQTEMGMYERATQTLENGLSSNFKIRDNPSYHYIRGVIDKKTSNLEDSVKSLTASVESIPKGRLLPEEKAMIYSELIEVHVAIGQIEEAANLLEIATSEFRGSPEEARMTILNAEQAMFFRNTEEAIRLLKSVSAGAKYFAESRIKLAEILLDQRKDKFAYLECYQEIVDVNPVAESYLLLGDAQIKIGMGEEAVSSYRKALEQSPNDAKLNVKMGRLLVETGSFEQAVNFYRDAIRSIREPQLKLELAQLYYDLKQYDKAEDLLITEIDSESGGDLEDLTYLKFKTKMLKLLGSVQEKSNTLGAALSTMRDAWDNQNRVRKRIFIEQGSVPKEDMQVMTEIAKKLADIAIGLRKNEQAVQFYKETLEISPDNVEILVALAELYMKLNSFDLCQHVCAAILKLDPENEDASLMMADICFRKIDFDMAQFHFSQLLVRRPTYWNALIRLIEIGRRTGNFTEITDFLQNAQSHCDPKDTSLAYCTALYHKYTANASASLRFFNQSKNDPEYGAESLAQMIDMCLNTEEYLLEEEYFFDSADAEYHDSKTIALKTADKLLKDLRIKLEEDSVGSRTDDILIKYKILRGFWWLNQSDRANVEKGLDEFVTLASQSAYKEHPGVTLGLATGYSLLKQAQRAKNQLKRTVKLEWNLDEADYIERCWLLYADHYVQGGKFDLATDLLLRILQYNRSYGKVHELLGFVCEKEQRVEDAVNHYESAWKYTGKMNAAIGYKLALNYMKCREFADAIDVAHQVLKLKPDYGKIRKEVLEKSINNLRI